MTLLSEHRLRGLAEALGGEVIDHPPTYGQYHATITHPDVQWKDSEGQIIRVEKLSWLQHDWPGAGFVLEWMGKQPWRVQTDFAMAVFNRSEMLRDPWKAVRAGLGELTPARIAQAAADALEVPE